MVKVLLDTNILIDLLNGVQAAFDEISYYDDVAISSITWMELVAGTPPGDLPAIQALLNGPQFALIHIDDTIMHEAAKVRRASLTMPPKLKLPDAIIIATANATGRLLVTRNVKDFVASTNVRSPYVLDTTQSPAVVLSVTPKLA